MKQFTHLAVPVVLIALIAGCGGASTASDKPGSPSSEAKQEADGSSEGVIVGSKTWTTQNLDVVAFRNGDSIPYARNADEWVQFGQEERPAWCYANDDPGTGEKYGKLYNYFAVTDPRGLAPLGWRIPSQEDVQELVSEAGGDLGLKMGQYTEVGTIVSKHGGTSLRSKSAWNGDDDLGFGAVPGGMRAGIGSFMDVDGSASFWISSTMSDVPMLLTLSGGDDRVSLVTGERANGFSVRCVK